MSGDGDWIRVRGARVHNLQNVSVDLPRGRMVVVTGPSGSGKSSLIFDTLYAEGQRRYLETLRVNSRAVFDQLRRPDVDAVESMPPPLCVSQSTSQAPPRSTLGTITEIDNHLRLLWSRLGTPHCYQCGQALHRHSIPQIVAAAMRLPAGARVLVLAPLTQNENGDRTALLQQIRQAGFLRVRVDGTVSEIGDNLRLNPKRQHAVEMVIDRLTVRPESEDRWRDSIDTALQFGNGKVILSELVDDSHRDHTFATRFVCPRCGVSYGELSPRDLSFNSPRGACPACSGLGYLPADVAAASARDGETDDNGTVVEPQTETVCPDCRGARLNREARSVRHASKTLPEVNELTVVEAEAFFRTLAQDTERQSAAEKVQAALVPEITRRLQFLLQVGLGYLTLGRPGQTLSGGESQRARLAGQLGAGLQGVCYILDEPTVGLHPRDTGELLRALRSLQQRGSTLVVVEHDEAVIRAADYLIEIGPGAGPDGGRVVCHGPATQVLTQILPSRRITTAAPAPPDAVLELIGVRHRNLTSVDVAFPLGRLVCITGVSGSGKSSLVYDVLRSAVRRRLGLAATECGSVERAEGLDRIDKLIEVDQSPLGRSTRSTPATYTGLFDDIRKLFAATREAKTLGFKANRFSFNARGSRCEECQGRGVLRVALELLPELAVTCPRCRGGRFDAAVLQVLFKGRTIADVLALSVREALDLFANVPALEHPLSVLAEIGLSYLKLGQPATSLSGGEAQRVKLAAELSRSTTGRTLLLLDEPTTGLNFTDVERLHGILRQLAAAGNTVIVIEHNLDLIAAADWVIDLGPGAGPDGGRIVAAGPPLTVAANAASVTGSFLREYLEGHASAAPEV